MKSNVSPFCPIFDEFKETSKFVIPPKFVDDRSQILRGKNSKVFEYTIKLNQTTQI